MYAARVFTAIPRTSMSCSIRCRSSLIAVLLGKGGPDPDGPGHTSDEDDRLRSAVRRNYGGYSVIKRTAGERTPRGSHAIAASISPAAATAA